MYSVYTYICVHKLHPYVFIGYMYICYISTDAKESDSEEHLPCLLLCLCCCLVSCAYVLLFSPVSLTTGGPMNIIRISLLISMFSINSRSSSSSSITVLTTGIK